MILQYLSRFSSEISLSHYFIIKIKKLKNEKKNFLPNYRLFLLYFAFHPIFVRKTPIPDLSKNFVAKGKCMMPETSYTRLVEG